MTSAPSERRLHPASVLFEVARHGRELLLPAFFVLVAGARGSDRWQVWLTVLLVPYAVAAFIRTRTFRYGFSAEELVIRKGLLFRQVRHVPYGRIQNIDAVENVLHRLLKVVQVRIETAGGEEPEAILNVVTRAAFDELRQVVASARGTEPAAQAIAPAAEAPILHLAARELVIAGLIQGRGLLVIGTLFGLLWEVGLADRLTSSIVGDEVSGRGVVRQAVRAMLGQGILHAGTLALTAGAFVALILVTRIFSVAWALVRLHGFTLRRSGDDVRAEFGLLTRVTSTVPVRRVQSVTIYEGPLHRLFGRVSVHVDTAGGEKGETVQLQREWLAPVIRPGAVPALLHALAPSLDATHVEWQDVDPRGVRRQRTAWLVLAAMLSLLFVLVLRWWTPVLFAAVAAFGEYDARKTIRAMGWSLSPDAVWFRSGWLWRNRTVVPLTKVQVVAVRDSPFDRRYVMARVLVDTAGAGSRGVVAHRVDVPYLPRGTADGLAAAIAAHAGRTAFRW